MQIFERGVLRPQTPVTPAAGGFAPKPPASGGWGLCPQTTIGLRRLGPRPQTPKHSPPTANFCYALVYSSIISICIPGNYISLSNIFFLLNSLAEYAWSRLSINNSKLFVRTIKSLVMALAGFSALQIVPPHQNIRREKNNKFVQGVLPLILRLELLHNTI